MLCATAMEPESGESAMSSRSKRAGWKQNWQAHVEQARARGMSLVQYCRERKLSVQSLYSARYLSSKQSRQSSDAAKNPRLAGKFVKVQITEPHLAASVMYRVRVKDCVIECTTLPPTSWLTSLMSGGADAVP
jgi:hypothetical protein